MSFIELQAETELGKGYLSELERGLVVPTVVALNKIAIALGLTLADLVAGGSPREELFLLTRALDKKSVLRLLDVAHRLAPPSTNARGGES
ncbi:MAG: helix-turn-helix transcriptional regulator [Deltaproteobacteria bacterium]|nr:helix-turn-helix transcriptional regulator [Deltaproteobacteria bacterium]